jgi:hypothetical protein
MMETVWVDVGTPIKNVWGVPDGCCPLPRLTPNLLPPPDQPMMGDADQDTVVMVNRGDGNGSSMEDLPLCHRTVEPLPSDVNSKAELHRVLNSIQCSNDFGVYLCESFRDPRRAYVDDYWSEVADQALGVDDLRHLLGKASAPLSDQARARFHQLARLFERLSKRIDRAVLAA